MPINESEIIQDIISGNKDSFKLLILEYQHKTVNLCYKFVNDSDDANDIAQEVFIELYKNIKSFRGDAKLSTWIYRIAVNKSLNFIRDNKKFKDVEKFNGELYKLPGTIGEYSDNPETIYINKRRKQLFDRIITYLPENQRTAFILSKIEGLSQNEISETMGISVKAVESLISRAKENLRKRLINYYGK